MERGFGSRRAVALVCLCVAPAACGGTATMHKPEVAPGSRPAAGVVIPAPASVQLAAGPPFVLTPTTAIIVPAGDERVAAVGRMLADLIGTSVAPVPLSVKQVDGPAPAGSIHLVIRSLTPAHDEAPAARARRDQPPPRLRRSAEASAKAEVAERERAPGVPAARVLRGGVGVGVGPREPEEGYDLTVSSDRVTIAASQPAGLFYGVQTLRHLLPAFLEHAAVLPDKSRPVIAPAVHIADQPRFAWRGAMLDVARHFLSVDEVKRYIDLMVLYKMNRLHLHLADDQGWRIDIASWPNLTRVGSLTEVGGRPGGYYTQSQYSELVAYAQARFVTIVPEIDMPGHTNAALASYAELNCDGVAPPLFSGTDVGFSVLCVDKDVTYRFIDDVVREIAALTPGPYFHVGGDEVKKLTPAQYVAFIERVQGIVSSHGKRMIGWDEIAPARLAPTSIVQHWRPGTSPKEAVAKGAAIILSPADKIYLDMKYDPAFVLGLNWAANIPVRDAYDWEPATFLAGVPESAILGVEAPLWSETVASIRDVELLAFPRLAGIAEIGWSPAGRRWDDYRDRLAAQAARWSALGVNFYRSPDVPWR